MVVPPGGAHTRPRAGSAALSERLRDAPPPHTHTSTPCRFVFQSSTALWVADTSGYTTSSFNVLGYTLSGGTWALSTPVFFEAAPIYSITGRSAGVYYNLYAVSTTKLWSYSTLTGATTLMATASAGTLYRGVTLPPYAAAIRPASPFHTETATPTATATSSSSASGSSSTSASISTGATPTTTATASHTASQTRTPSFTPTATVTPTPSRHPDIFHASSVLVLRLGTGSLAGTMGVAQAVFLDEYDPTGLAPTTLVSSLALPTATCTLANGKATASPFKWYDTEGFPQLSSDGQLVVLPCFQVAPGTVIADSTAVIKTVMIIRADGVFDVTTTTTSPASGTSTSATYLSAFHTVATADGSKLYATMTPAFTVSGTSKSPYVVITRGTATAGGVGLAPYYTNSPGNYDARIVGIYNFQLVRAAPASALAPTIIRRACLRAVHARIHIPYMRA